MTSYTRHRRVVTGLNAEGKSCILVDGPIPSSTAAGGIAWRTEGHPADNSVQADIEPEPFGFDMFDRGTIFMVTEYPPGMGSEPPSDWNPKGGPFWHTTDTIDYIVIIEGEVVLMTETGEVTLKKGDFFVDRGINHAWRNDSEARAVAAVVTVPAKPVGKGKTV